jgi:hypothetical protein
MDSGSVFDVDERSERRVAAGSVPTLARRSGMSTDFAFAVRVRPVMYALEGASPSVLDRSGAP